MKKYLVGAAILWGGMCVSVAFAATPVLTSVSPNPVAIGSLVMGYGSNFDSNSTLVFASGSNVVQVDPDSYSASGVVVRVPANVSVGSNTFYVKQKVSGEQSASFPLTIVAARLAPTISSLSPTSQYNSGNASMDSITIQGANFDETTAIVMDGNTATPIWPNGIYHGSGYDGMYMAVTPSMAPRAHTIKVGEYHMGGDGFGTRPLSSSLTFTALDAATRPAYITGVYESQGKPIYNDSDHVMVVEGRVYSDSYVLFDGNKVSTTFSPRNPNDPTSTDKVSFTISAGVVVGAHTVQLGSNTRTPSNTVTVTAYAPSTPPPPPGGGAGSPKIDSFSLGLVLIGGQVTVLGPDQAIAPFDCAALYMVIDGKVYPNASSDCGQGFQTPNTFIRAHASYTMPTNLTEGPHAFQVKDVKGNLSNTLNLEVAVPPVVSYSTPYTVAPGDAVTVYGSNFSAKTFVCSGFAPGGTIQKEPVTSYTATTLTFKIPANARLGALAASVYNTDGRIATLWPNVGGPCAGIPASGNVPVNIVNSVGAGAPQAPVITSLTPSTATPGSSVVVAGSGFDSGALIVIDRANVAAGTNAGAPQIIPTARSATSLTFTVPVASANFAGLANGAHTVQVITGIGAMTPSVYSNPMTLTISGSSAAAQNVPSVQGTPDTGTLSSDTGSFTASPTADGSLLDQIAALQAQLRALLAQQGGAPGDLRSMPQGSAGSGSASVPAGTSGAPNLTRNLSRGSHGDDVSALQTYLRGAGYLSINPSGFFGSATQAAVMAFQTDHGLPSTGFVGAMTRGVLGAEGAAGVGSSDGFPGRGGRGGGSSGAGSNIKKR